jgi:hypothetical protein
LAYQRQGTPQQTSHSVLFILSIIIAKQPEEGWVMTYMGLHFTVHLLIVGIALSYVVAPKRHARRAAGRPLKPPNNYEEERLHDY